MVSNCIIVMNKVLKQFGSYFGHKGVLLTLHMLIVALSIWLVVLISVETFRGIDFYSEPRFHRQQFWICMVFLADYFIELMLAKRKWHYLVTRFFFLLVSIPYQAIIYRYGLQQYLSDEVSYLLRFMPLIRGGFAVAIVVGWFTSNKATGLFLSYLVTLISMVYFASLTFFLFEHGHNPLVTHYTDALWWACMDVTTVGSNIVAHTGVGRVLSVVVAALGMMMFPIFTVYITNLITSRSKSSTDDAGLIKSFKAYLQSSQAKFGNQASQQTIPTEQQEEETDMPTNNGKVDAKNNS